MPDCVNVFVGCEQMQSCPDGFPIRRALAGRSGGSITAHLIFDMSEIGADPSYLALRNRPVRVPE